MSALAVEDSESSDVAEIVDIVDSEDDGDVKEVKVQSGIPPLRFQGYRRGRELGRGVSGQVFVCKRAGCKSGFAVKAVNLRRLQLRPNAEREWKKLCREVDILRKLPPHPNVVQLVDSFEDSNWFMIVLELVGGGDLLTALTARATPRFFEREAAFVMRQLLEGLDFLHAEKVIHRDLKLENILVSSQQKDQLTKLVYYGVKITDFGLSKHITSGGSTAKSTVGTRPYIAPEVLREGSHDFNSDFWCLGVVLYVLLVGHYPFEQIPTQQAHLDCIVDTCRASESAKCILSGLLQLEPLQRSSLSTIRVQDWFKDFDAMDTTEKPQKRHRTEAHDNELADSEVLMTSEPGIVEVKLSPLVVKCSEELAQEDSKSQAFSKGSETTTPARSQLGTASPLHMSPGIASPGTWTSFAEEVSIGLSEVRPASMSSEVMQVHMIIPDRFAGFILGKSGTRIQQIALDANCQVWMTSRDGTNDRRVVIIGNFKQCKSAQERVHEQLAEARRSDWRDTEAEVVLFVRAEAAGVVAGRHGFVLNQIRKQSGAQIQLLRDEVEGQRPCVISGTLQNVLKAEKHVFDLVRAVPCV